MHGFFCFLKSLRGMATDTFNAAFIAGAIAGFSVDVALFPLVRQGMLNNHQDTVKTRIQSNNAFRWSGLYKGLTSTLLGISFEIAH